MRHVARFTMLVTAIVLLSAVGFAQAAKVDLTGMWVFTVETSDLAAVREGTKARATPNPGQDGAGTRGYTFRAFAPQVLGDTVRADRRRAKH
jgi:hypothetical protein